ncbi:MAG: hypothetical protein MUF84_19865, partial [Anaerolineae bacterium]|nr:hypothetical protein [Anaerolineae bacterium]
MSRGRTRIAYSSGGTLLHRLHPLVKLGWLLLGTVLVFAVQSPWVVLAILGGLGWMWRRLAPGRVRGLRLA